MVARKPLEEKTVAENVLKHGTGGINIDECRVGMTKEDIKTNTAKASKKFTGVKPFGENEGKGSALLPNTQGRFPANIIHDGSDEVVSGFPETKTGAVKRKVNNGANQPINLGGGLTKERSADSGSAARFFKTCKYTQSDYTMSDLSSKESLWKARNFYRLSKQ